MPNALNTNERWPDRYERMWEAWLRVRRYIGDGGVLWV